VPCTLKQEQESEKQALAPLPRIFSRRHGETGWRREELAMRNEPWIIVHEFDETGSSRLGFLRDPRTV
jgi:hypothetical protein